MSKDDHWLNNSVVSRIARGPGFESRSGHDFFLPCDIYILAEVKSQPLLLVFRSLGFHVESNLLRDF